MKFLAYLTFLIFFLISFSNAEQEWIKKKKNKWITKNETKKIEWITKKNKKNDLIYITLIPLTFAMFYIKKLYDK